MKKLNIFISMKMKDRTEKEIKEEREHIIRTVKGVLFPQPIEIIDSYFAEFPNSEVKNPGAYYLGNSIVKLSEADVAVFGKDWDTARGCVIEHDVAVKYEIRRLYMSNF